MKLDFYAHRIKRRSFTVNFHSWGVLADLGWWFVHVLWWTE